MRYVREGNARRMGWGLCAILAIVIATMIAVPAQALAATPSVSYRTHVENDGWQGFVRDGEVSGTTGRALRLEGINIRLAGASGGIEYRTHVQDVGWEGGWRANGAMSGTTGQARRLEAIQIRLTGEAAKSYDVWYRVHAENVGWMGWAKNGAMVGTAAHAWRLEAIQVQLVTRGQAGPGASTRAYLDGHGYLSGMPDSDSLVLYRTHVENDGWQNFMRDGEVSGTTGRALRLEGINIRLGGRISGGIEYRTHIQDVGWEGGWRANGAMSGTTGQARRLEAIQIRLTGAASGTHDVWYRVHAENVGWMGWARDGEYAGTAGYAYRLEAIQVIILPKGAKAPGPTTAIFRQGGRATDGAGATQAPTPAVPAVKTYTVRFFNADRVLSTQRVAAGGRASAPVDPVAEHYHFVGWRTTDDDGHYTGLYASDELPAINSDVDYFAFMHPDYYTVTYVVDGVSTTELATYGGVAGIRIPYLGDDPRGFVGWRDEATGKVYAGNWEFPAVTGDVTYVAVFEDDTDAMGGEPTGADSTERFDVTFVIGDASRTATVARGEGAASAIPADANKLIGDRVFGGWTSSADGTIYSSFNLPAVTCDVTYTARLGDTNAGGDAGNTDSTSDDTGEPTGTDGDGGEDGTATPATYTVHFDASGGVGTMADQAVPCGEFARLSACAYTRDHYAFEYWTMSADGSGQRVYDGNNVRDIAEAGETITLYARWRQTSARYAYKAFRLTTGDVYTEAGGRALREAGYRLATYGTGVVTYYLRTDNPSGDAVEVADDDGLQRVAIQYDNVAYLDDAFARDDRQAALDQAWARPVEGGYLVSVQYKAAGTHELAFLEVADDGRTTFPVATDTVEVKDFVAHYGAFLDDVVARSGADDATLTPHERMLRACAWLGGDEAGFSYVPEQGGCELLIVDRRGRSFVDTREWDSYTSPRVLLDVASRIGYEGVELGTGDMHAYVYGTDGGATHAYTVCPYTSTGTIRQEDMPWVDFDQYR